MAIIQIDIKRLKRIILHYGDLIYCYTKANLRGEVARNFLGYAWWSLEPMLGMLVYYLVFAVGLRLGDENFLTFLLVGTSFSGCGSTRPYYRRPPVSPRLRGSYSQPRYPK